MLLFDLMQIGNRLFAYRKKLGLTQEEVAERAGCSVRTYADMERGTVNIRMETLLHICQVLGITPDDILTQPEPPQDEEAILVRLKQADPKVKSAALRLLAIYLDSAE